MKLNRASSSARSIRREGGLPPVSVIMPVYNGARYVAEAIESILNQTHIDFEFVIVNDGSTDETARILDEYAARDERIIVVHQENLDQPASLNRALRLARHEWIAITDHDDVSATNRLQRQLEHLREHPEISVLGTHVTYIDAYGNEIGEWTGGPATVAEFWQMRRRNQRIGIIHPSAMMNRAVILSLGGYRVEFGASSDSELWSRVSDEHVVVSLPERLVRYRKHSASMSMTRFAEQKRIGRWISARQYARRSSRPVPSYAERARIENGRLGLGRLVHVRDDRLRYFTRRRRLVKREGRRGRNLLYWMAIFLLDPSRPVRGLWRRGRRLAGRVLEGETVANVTASHHHPQPDRVLVRRSISYPPDSGVRPKQQVKDPEKHNVEP